MTLVTLHDLRKVAGLLAESPVVGTQAAHLLETAEAASGKADHGPWLTLLVKGSASGFPEVTETEDRGGFLFL